jgi:hypothetical protein|tara:strand:+ start:1820 stop:2314 length:495 start_codon:yes stop_codon:yes gene_type:complete
MSLSFKFNALMVYASLVVAAFVDAYTDNTYSFEAQMDIMTLVFQICAMLLTVVALYNVMSETTYLKRMYYGKIVEEFSPTFFALATYFVFMLISRVYKVSLIFAGYPQLAMWESAAGYTTLYSLMKVFNVLYYCTVVWAMQKLFASPELFKARETAFQPVRPNY